MKKNYIEVAVDCNCLVNLNWLLLVAGDVETNPGPGRSLYIYNKIAEFFKAGEFYLESYQNTCYDVAKL